MMWICARSSPQMLTHVVGRWLSAPIFKNLATIGFLEIMYLKPQGGLTPQAWAFVARCSDEKTDGNVNTLLTFATIGVHVYQISFSIWWILFMIWEGIISSPWWEREQSAWVWVTFGGRSMLNPDGSPLNSEDFYSLARVRRIAGQSTTNQWKMATAMFLWRKNSYFQMEQR